MADQDEELLRRWRLVVGSEAEPPPSRGQRSGGRLGQTGSGREPASGLLCGRAFEARESGREGGRGQPGPHAVKWLSQVRKLFPESACAVLQREALQRYGLHELLRDPETLAQVTPDMDLAKALIALMPTLPPASLGM